MKHIARGAPNHGIDPVPTAHSIALTIATILFVAGILVMACLLASAGVP